MDNEYSMSLDEALIILSTRNNKSEKIRIATACGNMCRAQEMAMQIARECIKRCRDFREIEEAGRQQ